MIKKAMSILEYTQNDLKNFSGNVMMAHSGIMDTILSGIALHTILIFSSKIPQRLEQFREEKSEVKLFNL